MTETVCQYCYRTAITRNHDRGALCLPHLRVVQAISTLETWGWPLTVARVRTWLGINRVPDVNLGEVGELCAGMPEFKERDSV